MTGHRPQPPCAPAHPPGGCPARSGDGRDGGIDGVRWSRDRPTGGNPPVVPGIGERERVAQHAPPRRTTVENLIAVIVVLAVATFATGLLLPLTTRTARDDSAGREAELAAELAAGR
jgi:hypothetical protein